jgi:ABC-2 type transport system ATP-binding protein
MSPAPAAPADLVARELWAGYGGAPVLRGATLAVDAGRVHGLVGRNGAGKTTLLDVIAGHLAPVRGTLLLGGRPLVRADVAYVPTELHVYPRITGREHLAVFAAGRAARGSVPFDFDAWADGFSLPLDAFADEYSAGMRRKLALLGGLALGRPVLLLDEPANGLDVEANHLLNDLLRTLASNGTTVLVTSHVLEALAATCDRIHLLEAGVVAATYEPTDYVGLAERLMSGEVVARRDALRRLVKGFGD